MRATIYNASAGSGKTYTLAYKYVRDVIEEPQLYRKILAVTFTNKATEEMKRRILSEIHALASGAASGYLERLQQELHKPEPAIRALAKEVRTSILHDYSRFTILTIDRFFQRIIRAFIQELGIDINYNIELDPATLLTQGADRIIEELAANKELSGWIQEFIEERIEDGRSWDIREGILSLGGEVFKESNRATLDRNSSKAELKKIVDNFTASSQKSKTKMSQIAQRALEIVAEDGLSITESFAGKSRSFVLYFSVVASGQIKEPGKAVLNRLDSIEGWGKGVDATAAKLLPLLREVVEIYFANIKKWNTTTLLRENYRSFALLTDLYEMVKEVSNEQNIMLLSETKLILSKFIEGNDAPFIFEKIGNRFSHYMIDEFQDTSLKEWQNFLPLLKNALAESEEEQNPIFIVGDIKQSIYRWRGGDWRILHSLAREDLGEEQTQVINLKENYRSLPNIVKFNNALIEAVVEEDSALLRERIEATDNNALNPDAKRELSEMLPEAYRDQAQIPRKKGGESQGHIAVTLHPDEPQIVERILEVLDQGFRPCEILILVRSNREGVKVAGKLLEFKNSNLNPAYYFDVMTQEALTVGLSPVSQFVVAVLMLSTNERDSIQRAIYNRFIGREAYNAPLEAEEIDFLRQVRLLSTQEAFEYIVIRYHLDTEKRNIAYLQAIHESICGFCSSKSGDIALFLKWWEEHGSSRSISVEQSDFSIEITTIHKAKGLEKAVVLIPYCTWALDPKSSGSGKVDPKKPQAGSAVWAQGSEEIEELGAFPVKYKKVMSESLFSEQYYRELVYSHIDNINMLYVALTRASQSLHIFIKRDKIGIGRTIAKVLATPSESITLGQIEGTITTLDQTTTYTFGQKSAPLQEPDKKRQSRLYIMDSYPSAKADLRLRLPSQRYFEELEEGDADVEITPRHEGILMHQAFAEATTAADIVEQLATMQLNGKLSEQEHSSLKEKIDRALEQEPIKGWFSDQWERVYNERDIIIPHGSTFKRPDRVMVRGKEAVVVDYKFGQRETKAHLRQVEEYVTLLRQMGYKRCSGYVWYIKSGKIIASQL